MEKRRRFRPRPDLLEGRRLLAVTPAGVAITATEDQLFVGLVATFTANDPSPQSEDNYSATIDWGDGRTSEGFVIADPDVPGQFGVGDEHTYAETGTYSVTVTINDLVDGTSSTINSTAVVIAPPPLTATSRTVNPTEGTPLTDVVTTFTDAAPNGTAGDYSATIDWGDGHTTYGTITGNPRGGFNVTGTNTYADPGPYPVNVVIRSDRDGRVASADSLAVVADAPLLAVPAAVVANEGEPLDGAILATFTDVGGADPTGDYAVTINWGDGTPPDTTTGTVDGAGGNFRVAGSHTYTQEGSFLIVLRIAGKAVSGVPRSAATVSVPAGVADAPLSVAQVAPVVATVGTPVPSSTVATFRDAGGPEAVGSYEALIDWGDGTPGTRGTLSLDGSTFTVTGGHTFATPGTFRGGVLVRSSGGSVATGSFTSAVSTLALTSTPVVTIEGVALTDVAVATLRSQGGPDPAVGLYTATIDWGDGTQPSPGTITGNGSTLGLSGSHTYAESGTYSVRVTVGSAVYPALVTSTAPADVADVPIVLTGKLDPASDSGVSNQDRITVVAQPNFLGTSEPGSVVQLYAEPAGGPRLPIGKTTADAGGAWSITSNVPLADGTYTIVATAVDRHGVTAASGPLTDLTIDTIGPQVTALTFDRLRGQFTVTFQDERGGLDRRPLTDGANYRITRPLTRLGRLRVTSLAVAGPAGPLAVTGFINDGRQMRPGSYDIVVRSGGITDVAGNALDGDFYGFFPSGNGPRGGDFRARINTAGRLVSAPRPVETSATPLSPPGTPGRRMILGPRGLQGPPSLAAARPLRKIAERGRLARHGG